MTIQETIKDEIKKATLARDAAKLLVVRGLSAAFMNEAIAKSQPALTDEEALAVIRRAVKQRKDSIDQFTKGGRPELAASEAAELAILETYLPKMMDKDEVTEIVKKKFTEMGIIAKDPDNKAKAGKIIGLLMKELKGKADGANVKEVVEKLL